MWLAIGSPTSMAVAMPGPSHAFSHIILTAEEITHNLQRGKTITLSSVTVSQGPSLGTASIGAGSFFGADGPGTVWHPAAFLAPTHSMPGPPVTATVNVPRYHPVSPGRQTYQVRTAP